MLRHGAGPEAGRPGARVQVSRADVVKLLAGGGGEEPLTETRDPDSVPDQWEERNLHRRIAY